MSRSFLQPGAVGLAISLALGLGAIDPPAARTEPVEPRGGREFTPPPVDVLEELRAAAGDGDAGDRCRLGVALLEFNREETNLEAFEQFSVAAEELHVDSLFLLAACYGDGIGVERDPEAAVDYLRRAANLGQDRAQMLLGWVLLEGVAVEKDPAAAQPWLRRSVIQGNPVAMSLLSQCHLEGDGVEKDPEKALELADTAAESGHAVALMHLADLHATGRATDQDLTRALELLEQADGTWADNNRAWLLATAPGHTNGPEALRVIRDALERIEEEDVWLAIDTLAAAHARVGDLEAAVETQRQALVEFERWRNDHFAKSVAAHEDEWIADQKREVEEAEERLQQRLTIYTSGQAILQDPVTEEITPDKPTPSDQLDSPATEPSPDQSDQTDEPDPPAEPTLPPGKNHPLENSPGKLRNFPRELENAPAEPEQEAEETPGRILI